MSVKSTVNKTISEKERTYPYLGKLYRTDCKDSFVIVLFTAKNTGVVVAVNESQYWIIGSYSIHWDEKLFSVSDVSVTLENE